MPSPTSLATRLDLEGASKGPLAIIGVFAVSVLATLAFWTVLPNALHVTMATDYSGFYEPVARNIAAGNGITNPDGSPAIRYPPGYPLLLSPAFWISEHTPISEATALSAFTLFFAGLASVSLFLLVRGVFGGVVALCAAVLWISYPFALWLTKEPMSAVPFMASLYLALCALWHASTKPRFARSWYALAGALSGLSMLIRPIAMGLGVLLSIHTVFAGRDATRKQRLVFGMMVLLGNLVIVAPWEFWVHSQTGRLVLLSSGGTPSIVDGLTYAVREKGYRNRVAIPADVRDLMESLSENLHSTDDGRRPGGSSDAQHMSTLSDVVATMVGELRERPTTVMKLFGQKAVRSWYAMDSAKNETLTLALQCVYIGFVIWGGIAAWRLGDRSRRYVILVASVMLYFWLMTTLVLSILRYMVPVMGLLITLIPVGLSRRNLSTETAVSSGSPQ